MSKHLPFVLVLFAVVFSGCEKSGPDLPPDDAPVSYTLRQKRSAKRGVAQNQWALPETDLAYLAPAVCWTYNWGSGPLSSELAGNLSANDIEFVPMAWNNHYNEAGLKSAEEYILAFNEPNLTDQANMRPEKAAEYWPDLVKIAKESGKKLVSPALNYGTLAGYSDPVKWLDDFLAQPGVSLDDIDAIALHCYMPNATSVKNFIDRFEKYGKPVWLTEFCNGNSTNISYDTQRMYMTETLNMLEMHPMVERYAWFMARGGFNSKWSNNLLATTSPFELTELGKIFVNMSSCDDDVVYSKGEVIPAEQYSACSGEFHLDLSSDGGTLDVTDFRRDCEMVYHIDMPKAGEYYFTLRYQTYMTTNVSFGVGDDVVGYALRNTGNEWTTESFKITLPKGKSDFVLRGLNAASLRVNWMRID